MSVVVVIPARWGSGRLPGKALADVRGVPLVERVRRAAVASDVGPVIVATDDARIADVVRVHGGDVGITGPAANGTLRVAEAVRGRGERWIVNVQGDQPFLDPAHVREVAEAVRDAPVATLAASWPPDVDPRDPARVKAIVDPHGWAVDFRRTAPDGPFALHVGIYGFQADVLAEIARIPPSARAIDEGLEQLTWLDAHVPIAVRTVMSVALPVDTLADLTRAREVAEGEGCAPPTDRTAW